MSDLEERRRAHATQTLRAVIAGRSTGDIRPQLDRVADLAAGDIEMQAARQLLDMAFDMRRRAVRNQWAATAEHTMGSTDDPCAALGRLHAQITAHVLNGPGDTMSGHARALERVAYQTLLDIATAVTFAVSSYPGEKR